MLQEGEPALQYLECINYVYLSFYWDMGSLVQLVSVGRRMEPDFGQGNYNGEISSEKFLG